MNELKSISVLIITYNQQDVVGRALDSVLIQKEWGLKEIIICDDCSTDNNWGVIQKYASQFPNIIRAYSNNPNLGIYGNIEKTISMRGNCDLYIALSGDDAFCDGAFEMLQKFIFHNAIDTKQAISIYFDWKIINPRGKEIFFSNKKILKKVDSSRLRLRYSIYNRGTFISSSVINKFRPIPKQFGVTLSEDMFELQYQQYTDINYHCPFVSSIYYSQMGVSTKMKTKKHAEESIFKWNYFINNLDLNKKDIYFARMRIHQSKYSIKPSIKEALTTLVYKVLSIDFSLGIDVYQDYFLIRSLIRGLINQINIILKSV